MELWVWFLWAFAIIWGLSIIGLVVLLVVYGIEPECGRQCGHEDIVATNLYPGVDVVVCSRCGAHRYIQHASGVVDQGEWSEAGAPVDAGT